MNKRLGLIAGAAALVLGSGAAAAVAISAKVDERSPRLRNVSNYGVLVRSLPTSQHQDLRASGITSDVRLLGEKAGISFYVAEKQGQPCFLTSNKEAPRPEFSVVACLGAGSRVLPSSEDPIVDFSAAVKEPRAQYAKLTWLAGFAADGVAAVGVESPDGRTYKTPVAANIYADRRFSSVPMAALVAFDAAGNEIYRQEIRIGG